MFFPGTAGKRKVSDGEDSCSGAKKASHSASGDMTLPDMPDDVLYKIAFFLEFPDRVRFKNTCKKMRSIEAKTGKAKYLQHWKRLQIDRVNNVEVTINLNRENAAGWNLRTVSNKELAGCLQLLIYTIKFESVDVNVNMHDPLMSECVEMLPHIECKEITISQQRPTSDEHREVHSREEKAMGNLSATFINSNIFFTGAHKLQLKRMSVDAVLIRPFYELIKSSSLRVVEWAVIDADRYFPIFAKALMGVDNRFFVKTPKKSMARTNRNDVQVFYKKGHKSTTFNLFMEDGNWTVEVRRSSIPRMIRISTEKESMMGRVKIDYQADLQ